MSDPANEIAVTARHAEALTTGYIHICTGEGKGKTSAAMGLALRALGHRHRVFS